jgi:hypothetical protein
LFSTVLPPRGVNRDWWYVAPRNGHISIYSEACLQQLAARHDVKYFSLNDGLHVFFRRQTAPVLRQIAKIERDAALYAASLRGFRSFLYSARLFGELGIPARFRDLKHLARSVLHALRR